MEQAFLSSPLRSNVLFVLLTPKRRCLVQSGSKWLNFHIDQADITWVRMSGEKYELTEYLRDQEVAPPPNEKSVVHINHRDYPLTGTSARLRG